jgi:hypothetical protein
MTAFQKSKTALLEELIDLVGKTLTKSQDFKTIGEKRYNRKLKLIRKELKKWIAEMDKAEVVAEGEIPILGKV